jgi:indolepyruvate ferredoxin oxidoreductase beta subunit
MNTFNIYLAGVGGQGIGLLSEAILRAADHGGHGVQAVDTHGLAQRGGIVVSQVRLGDGPHSPLIPAGRADLVVALERHEALRAMDSMLQYGGTLVYYNTIWQPLAVRRGEAATVTDAMLDQSAKKRGIRVLQVFKEGLEDVRMQNIVLLAAMARNHLVPDVKPHHYEQAIEDLMAGPMLEKNLTLFREEI